MTDHSKHDQVTSPVILDQGYSIFLAIQVQMEAIYTILRFQLLSTAVDIKLLSSMFYVLLKVPLANTVRVKLCPLGGPSDMYDSKSFIYTPPNCVRDPSRSLCLVSAPWNRNHGASEWVTEN